MTKNPWDDEPDELDWTDAATGLSCRIFRNPMGALCGYVGVPKKHRLFEKHYDDKALRETTVHGGLTYSNHKCDDANNLWWFGFDCAHYMDYTPKLALGTSPESYRNIEYVKAECASLAEQLK